MKPVRRRIFEAAAVVALAFAAVLPAWAQSASSPPFRIGVLPNVSARIILTQYQPMRQYFERVLGQAVEIQTAPDFKTYYQRTVAGEYDVAVIAANLGRLAEKDHTLAPIAIYDPPIPGLLVTTKSRPVKTVEELRGKKLAMANPQSLVVLRGLGYLKERGLEAGRDFATTVTANEDSLSQLLASNEAPLAMMSMGEFRLLREAIRNELEIFAEFARVPGFLVMLGSKVPATTGDKIKAAFVDFGENAEGKAFFEATGFRAIRAPTAAELDSLDAFLADTRRFMGS
jgi:phosphonate transport system substrate-binding protein